MAASVPAWHDHLSGSSMDGIEEGLLDDTTFPAFPQTTDHNWKELVSDPSLSVADIALLEKSKTGSLGDDVQSGIGHKDWDQYSSAFSLNDDEDSTKFMKLEVSKDNSEDRSGGRHVKENKEHYDEEIYLGVGIKDTMENVALPDKSTVPAQGLQSQMEEQISSFENSSHVAKDVMFPPTSTSVATISVTSSKSGQPSKDYSPDGTSLFESSKTVPFLRPSSAPVTEASEINSRPGSSQVLSSTNPGVRSGMLETRSKSALEVQGPAQSSSFPRANSAPLWQDTHMNKQTTSLGLITTSYDDFQTGNTFSLHHKTVPAGPKVATSLLYGEGSMEQRHISGADDDFLNKNHPSSQAGSPFPRNPAGHGDENEISVEDLYHSSGDGKHDQESNVVLIGNTDLSSKQDETVSVEQETSTTSKLDHAASLPETSNVVPSREAAENLPIRPLTIGNSLTIGSSLAYRPVSPFQPDLYPTGAASSIPAVTSTTSDTPAYLSASQYSEGILDMEEDGGGDMSARERLQPLGRDGLEVKQGPPWGITMPLFQPDSRNSSLSSNDSNASNSQFVQLQATSSPPSKLETEPLQSVSSTLSETNLSRKTSVKSLESKEPMGVKMMNGAGTLKTPVAKFHQLNPPNVDGDSPVSKILGPTFKATQRMLEELQRRPLGAYDDDMEDVNAEKMSNKSRIKNDASETPVTVKETVVTDQRPSSRSYVGLESDTREESRRTDERSTQGDLRPQDISRTYETRFSREKIEKPTRDSPREVSISRRTPDLTALVASGTGSAVVSRVDNDLKGIQDNQPSSRAHLNRDPFSAVSIDQRILNLTPITTTNVGLAINTLSPVVSMKSLLVHDHVSSQTRKNESHKTSGMTDSTLGHSVGLSGHLAPAENKKVSEGGAIGNADPESLSWESILETRKNASDVSEFDRVASESISWSSAVANQFREEMKSADLAVEGFQGPGDEETSVDEPGTTTPVGQDSGLSESTTNDEIYRPKGLTHLFAGNGPVGIYDVRQSSGPGSTNRKRLALGRKPRESHLSMPVGDIYVSDGASGTSGTDSGSLRRSRQSGRSKDPMTHRGVYVSEGTTSGTEAAENGMDSGPEGQSTPKSGDISGRQSNASVREFSAKENVVPLTEMYLGFSNYQFQKPAKGSRPSFASYEIEKPSRLTPSSYMNYQDEKPERKDPLAFSTFEIDKPLRAKSVGASRNDSEPRGSSFEAKVLTSPQKGSIVMRRQPHVQHTWSISKPVMSQLSTNTAPLVTHEVAPQLKNHTQPQPSAQKPPTQSSDHRQKRVPREKEAVLKPVRQPKKDQSSQSEKTPENSGTAQRKKSVADIILENMIQEEQEQKKRHKKLEVKQERTTQDLNQLWERFQEVVGKKSRSSRGSKTSRIVRPRPAPESTSTDVSVASSTHENRKNGGRAVDMSLDSDEEFERFLRRIREIQSSDSTSYLEDSRSITSRISSGSQRFASGSTPSERPRRKPHHKAVDSSTSITSVASSDDKHGRRNGCRTPVSERPSQNAARQNISSPVVVRSSVTEKKPERERPVSLPTWFSTKDREMMRKGKTSSSCTCGAKARKEKPKTSVVRDVGVNCPTPPLETAEMLPVVTDLAVLKSGPCAEDIPNPSPASLVKLTLQDAFMYSKQEFVERSRYRVRKLKEKQEERKNEKTSGPHVVVVVPSDKTKPVRERQTWEEDRPAVGKGSKFELLQQKKPRPMTTKEIRDVNKRMYKNLPEVRKRRDEERRAALYKTNRLRAQLYGKHVRNTNRIFTAA